MMFWQLSVAPAQRASRGLTPGLRILSGSSGEFGDHLAEGLDRAVLPYVGDGDDGVVGTCRGVSGEERSEIVDGSRVNAS